MQGCKRTVAILGYTAVFAAVCTSAYLLYSNLMEENFEKRKPSSQQSLKTTECTNNQEKPADYKHPWERTACVLSFGCSHNMSDGEYMSGLLKADGYTLTDKLEGADVLVVNSCTVKNPSQDTAMNLVLKAEQMGLPIIVGGCVPQAEKQLAWLSNASLIGVEQLAMLPEIAERAILGERTVHLKSDKTNPSLFLPKVRRNEFVEIIPVNQGCLGRCTYCKTRYARGSLASYDRSAILERATHAVDTGATNIWLTSEDTGAYGLDKGDNLSGLCKDLIALVEAHPRSTFKCGTPRVHIRIGMTNPPFILDQLTELCEVFNNKFFFRHLHIPIQSGSDEVLEEMKRDYSVADFKKVCDTLQVEVKNPCMRIATDIICGFPSETRAQHKETLDLLEEYKFPTVNISQFYPRPGTPAAKMKPGVPAKEKKIRTGEVTNLFNSYETFSEYNGSVVEVWFTELSERSQHIVGHTIGYAKVLVPLNSVKLGEGGLVKIHTVSKWHLEGEVVRVFEER